MELKDVLGNCQCGYYSCMILLKSLDCDTDIFGNKLNLEDVVLFRKELYKFTTENAESVIASEGWNQLYKNPDGSRSFLQESLYTSSELNDIELRKITSN